MVCSHLGTTESEKSCLLCCCIFSDLKLTPICFEYFGQDACAGYHSLVVKKKVVRLKVIQAFQILHLVQLVDTYQGLSALIVFSVSV